MEKLPLFKCFYKNNCFHYAVINSKFEIVNVLLDHTQFFKVNKKDFDSNTALHEAVIHKDMKIVLCLLKKGKVDVNSRNGIFKSQQLL